MNIDNTYPRVLLVYISRINKADQHGVSIRGWFGDWPRENMAQIYSGGEMGEEGFCKYNFLIGQKERRFGKYFFQLKGSPLGKSSYPLIPEENLADIKKINYWTLIKNKLSNLLINSGLWEIIFSPILSKELINFIKEFNPQIIYCQGYSLSFTWLPVLIHKKFKVPICFQTGDDWPSELYRNTAFSFFLRPVVRKSVRSLLKMSAVRLANGKLMENEYRKRYKMSFSHIMMCDSLDRFQEAGSKRIVEKDAFSIIYSGNLGHGRWRSIVELCKVAELLEKEGLRIILTVFATSMPHEAINDLKELKNLHLLPGLSHEELPACLKGADILFLPETFDPSKARVIKLSISTKAHLYMMSEKPTLLYASPITGISQYVTEEKEWACKVDVHDLNKLSDALFMLLTNKEYREKLVRNGLDVAIRNHDERKVRKSFLSFLTEKANTSISQ